METMLIALLAGALGAAILHIFIDKRALPVVIQLPEELPHNGPRVKKVAERDAAQLIRRIRKQGYEVLIYVSDRMGNIYVIYQWEKQGLEFYKNGLTYKASVV